MPFRCIFSAAPRHQRADGKHAGRAWEHRRHARQAHSALRWCRPIPTDAGRLDRPAASANHGMAPVVLIEKTHLLIADDTSESRERGPGANVLPGLPEFLAEKSVRFGELVQAPVVDRHDRVQLVRIYR